jgi:uncharacterized protein (TIGR03790 family)
VPASQIFGIRVRAAETITRKEFNENIRNPILRFMVREGLLAQQPVLTKDPVFGELPAMQTVDSKISYIVLVRCAPLGIEKDPTLVESNATAQLPEPLRRNEASVDSELTLMPSEGLPVVGYMPNPFFRSAQPGFGAPMNQAMVLVGRLDGPDTNTVRRMIDEALAAERLGLHGRAYFDARGVRDKGYAAGDEWILNTERKFRLAGFECELDQRAELFDEDFPMTDAAAYAGWYTEHVAGPFRRSEFRFKPGAVACHIHSWSGSRVRSRQSNWIGPMLDKGAAACIGNVYEPYLTLSQHVDVFYDRLLSGWTFLEAAYASQPALGWQSVFVGDPLYRPFAASLDEQIALLEADRNPDVAWAYVRKINLLAAGGQWAEAEKLCRTKAEALASPVLNEKLGDLLHAAKRYSEATGVYQRLLRDVKDYPRLVRISTKLAGAYEAGRQPALALAVYDGLAMSYANRKSAVEFYKKARDLAIAIGDPAKAQSYQAKIDALTAPPPAPSAQKKPEKR